MRRNLSIYICIILAGCLLLGPLAHAQQALKVDNFFIVLDLSLTMSELYKGDVKFLAAQRTAKMLVESLPRESPLNGGIRTFGYSPLSGKEQTKADIPMRPFDKDFFKNIIKGLTKQGGNARLSKALDAVMLDLANAQGRTVLIVITDGLDNDRAENTKAAKSLKQQYSDSLCIYTVIVGRSRPGAENLRDIAKAGKCGFSTSFDVLENRDRVKDFVKMVFFEDQNPDSDRDGVPDAQDQCPNTPFGASVDARGCWIIPGIQFDTDSAEIKAQYYPLLAEVANVLDANPEMNLEIQGHTDNQGAADYNLNLSGRRAESVKNYLIQIGIEPPRLRSVGYGETKPAATNDTPEGRAINRRIELKLME